VSEPIPVLQVVVSTQAGGGPQHVLAVALGLRARGWRPIVAGPADGALFARFREAGVETLIVRTDRLSPLTLVRLVRAIRGHGVRLVHSHGKGAGLHGRLAARLTGVPAVHTLHGIHYERYPAPARAAYLALERRLSAWTRAREIHAVNRAGKVTNTGLQPLGAFDAPTGLVTTEVKVKSHDGAMVPLSIIHRADVKLDGTNPALLYGYGSYGFSEDPNYQAMRLAWLERGGVYAVANVRGSSVYGYDWYKAGYKTTKPNTWKDFIACAEYLIAQNYTTSARLGILGGSAGGILVGRAMTERPDLFAAVVPLVGVLDAIRAETTANGVPNIPEFGTVTKEDEFRALLAMSSYHNVKDATAYPAVMLIHGVNDVRVDYWHSSKMAARLLAASSSSKPILLNLDYEAGHGIGSTKQQRQRQVADYYAFLFWQTGHAEFQRH